MDVIKLVIPSNPQYVTTLRLTTSSIAQIMGFDIESIDDLKVCVSEAVNDLFSNNEALEICFKPEEDKITIVINATMIEETDGGLHRMILESLLDKVEYKENSLLLVKNKQ